MNDLERKHYDFLIQENQKYNLTSITDLDEAYVKHFIDSYMLGNCFDLNNSISICDVGSGAGFPGIALKLKYPNIKLTIIESMNKRCLFLEELVKTLGLNDVNIICTRAEDAKDLREKFDVVTARAVANLSILMELCVPLVKVNGFFAPYKGSNYQEEIESSSKAAQTLGIKLDSIYEYNLNSSSGEDYGNHAIIKYLKIKETDAKYPRPFSQIKKKSL